MQWENIPSVSGNEVYHLSDNNKQILSLSYHPFSNSARVDYENEKRVFLIRREGFRRNKTIVRNEYGVKVCELGTDNGRNFIHVNDERFYYNMHPENGGEIKIYRENETNPMIVCGLNQSNGEPTIEIQNDKNLVHGIHPGLLIALCLYMNLPVSTLKLEGAAV